MESGSLSKSGATSKNFQILEKIEQNLPETASKCLDCAQETENGEDESFLRVKFQKLVVSSLNSPNCHKSISNPVLRSEKEVFQLRKTCSKPQNKSILRKSKLGESFKKFRTPADLTTAIQDSKDVTTSENQKIFGRKFSFSLENFGSLSILERKDPEEAAESSSEFTTDSFKNFNGSGSKRKRAKTPEMEEQEVPTMVSCGQQARLYSDVTADELAGYLEDTAFFPKRMSYMAEMMYT